MRTFHPLSIAGAALPVLSLLTSCARAQAPSTPTAAPKQIALQLHNVADAPRRNWPVSSGVPLARGVLQDEKRAHLRDANGRETDLQTRVTSRWDDGSVKWLLLDFQANVPANAKATYTLDTAAAAPRNDARGIQVKTTDDEITVDTGRIRFAVPRRATAQQGFSWISQLAVKTGNDNWQNLLAPRVAAAFTELEHTAPGAPEEENWLRHAAGGARDRYEAAGDREFSATVEEAGPLRVTLRLQASQLNAAGKRFAPLMLRISAFRDSPLVKVLHTFTFTGDAKTDFIRSMALTLPLAGDNLQATFGAGPAGPSDVAKNGAISLTEIGPDKFYHNIPYTADKRVGWTLAQGGSTPAADKTLAEGYDAPGWMNASTSAGKVTVALRDFKHEAPKELRIAGDGTLSVYLWPENGDRVLDFRRRYDYVDNDVHYDLSMYPYGGLGVAKTHEIWFDFSGASGSALQQFTDEPLYALPAPESVRDSGVFGPFAVRDPQRFPRMEAYQDLAMAWIRRNQQAFRWDGMLDYGDTLFIGLGVNLQKTAVRPDAWGSRGYSGWLNDDLGLCHTLFLQALRSGDRTIFKMAELMTRHVMDVDVCHYCPPAPEFVGAGHRHDQQHWGNHTVGYGTATHGTIDYYLLLGDERARDVARETAEWHLHTDGGEPHDRTAGLWRAWEITGETKYRDAARKFLREEIAPPRDATTDKNWPFRTIRHMRFVSHTSNNFVLYRAADPDPELKKSLDAGLVQAAKSAAVSMLSSWRDHGFQPGVLLALGYDLSRDPQLLDAAKSDVRDRGIPADLDPKVLWPEGLDALPFERIIELAKKAGINNVYHQEMFTLNAFPYLQYAFELGGVTESDIDALKLVNDAAEPFEETLDPKKIRPEPRGPGEPGLAYVYALLNNSQSDKGGTSTLRLFEDGKELGPAHSPHVDIRTKGQGRWSHWGSNGLVFSTSDNSDPRTNGRKYTVKQE
jgi:hypothetical protein